MPLFATKETRDVRFGNTPEDESKVNCVTFVSRPSVGMIKRIQRASFSVEVDPNNPEQAIEVPVSAVEQMMASLQVLVTNWDGPLFGDVDYSPKHWEDLDADDNLWWISLVHEAMNKSTSAPKAQDPTLSPGNPDPNSQNSTPAAPLTSSASSSDGSSG